MAVTTQDLASFQRFAEARISIGDNDLMFDELVEQWLLAEHGDEEIASSLASLDRGLADIDAGRYRPAEDVFRDLAERYQAKGES